MLEQLADREQRRIKDDQLRRIEGEEMSRRIQQIKAEEKQVYFVMTDPDFVPSSCSCTT